VKGQLVFKHGLTGKRRGEKKPDHTDHLSSGGGEKTPNKPKFLAPACKIGKRKVYLIGPAMAINQNVNLGLSVL